MLVLVSAITAGIVLALIIFCYNYVRLFAAQGQTKNAIDAAALTAAADLSRIAVNTDEYGYIALSDVAPTGPVTVATDQYYLPVRSINSIIGTCRLDNQLAIQMKDPVLSQLAQYDRTQAQSAIAKLETALAASLKPGGSATDIFNQPVTPYADAEAAYQANDLRSGQTYVPGSLVLTLGALTKPIPTNVNIPQPTTMSGLQTSQYQNNCYLSDTQVPFGNGGGQYGTQNVVFAPVAQTTRLVDPKTFVAQLNGVPSAQQMLAAVKAVANEKVVDSQNPQGNTVVVASCAVPANNVDPRPAPGALSISFPDGPVPDWKTPNDMLNDPQLAANPTDLQHATGGDYPTDNGSSMDGTSFWIAQQPSEANIARVCIYDWVRRAGTKANLKSITDILATNFHSPNPTNKDWWTYTAASPNTAVNVSAQAQGSPQIPQGIIHIYKFNADGSVAYTSKNTTPWPYAVLSENQMFGESLGGFNSATISQPVFVFPNVVTLHSQQHYQHLGQNHTDDPAGTENVSSVTFTSFFDGYFRDEVRQPGTKLGGKHGGEPLNNAQVAFAPTLQNTFCNVAMLPTSLRKKCIDFGGGGTGAFHNNGHGGGHHGNGPPGGGGGGGVHGHGPGGNTGGWGGGATPMIEPQSDFGENSSPPSPYVQFPTGSGQVRPTYTTNGTAIEIRFRRQLTVSAQLQSNLTNISDVGYLGYLGK